MVVSSSVASSTTLKVPSAAVTAVVGAPVTKVPVDVSSIVPVSEN